jgi:hypothetical protein
LIQDCEHAFLDDGAHRLSRQDADDPFDGDVRTFRDVDEE